MDKDIVSSNHIININQRKSISITGVKKIENFDENEFLLETNMGYILIKGMDLEIIKLDTYQGDVSIKGKVDSLSSAFLEWFNKVTYNKKNYIKIVLSFLIVTSFSIIYFIGIQKIGNAILHVYSLISIVVGFIVYDFIIKIIANNNKK